MEKWRFTFIDQIVLMAVISIVRKIIYKYVLAHLYPCNAITLGLMGLMLNFAEVGEAATLCPPPPPVPASLPLHV